MKTSSFLRQTFVACISFCLVGTTIDMSFGQVVNANTIVYWTFNGTLGADIESEIDVASGVEMTRFNDADLGGESVSLIYGESNPFFNTVGTSAEFTNLEGGNDPGVGLFANDPGVDSPLDLSTLGQFTVEAFVRPTNVRQSVVIRKYVEGRWFVDLTTGEGFCFRINDDNNRVCTGAGSIEADTWYSVVATFDENDELSPMKIYLDGELANEGGQVDRVLDSERSLGIGTIVRDNENPPGNSGQFFHGNIDEVRVSSVVLPPELWLLNFVSDRVQGDVNGDDVVDLADFGIIASNFNTSGRTAEEGDLNFDSQVNLTDFLLFRGIFTASNPSVAAASVPEPNSLSLIVCGLMVLTPRRRARCDQPRS